MYINMALPLLAHTQNPLKLEIINILVLCWRFLVFTQYKSTLSTKSIVMILLLVSMQRGKSLLILANENDIWYLIQSKRWIDKSGFTYTCNVTSNKAEIILHLFVYLLGYTNIWVFTCTVSDFTVLFLAYFVINYRFKGILAITWIILYVFPA